MPAQDAALTRAELLRRFPELRAPLQHRLARLVGAADAEDLAGETLLRALEAVDGFRGQASLATWLHRIAANLAYDLLRQRSRSAGCDDRDAHSEADGKAADANADDAGLALQHAQMSRCMRDLLDRLPAPQRQLLFEADMLDRPLGEIAGRSGITTGNAKIRLHRARRAIRSALKAHCDFDRENSGTLCCVPKLGRRGNRESVSFADADASKECGPAVDTRSTAVLILKSTSLERTHDETR